MYRLMIALLCILLISCEQRRLLIRSLAVEPGEKLVVDSGTVWDKYDCNNRNLPFLAIEQNEIHPIRLNPGVEFHHHFSYIMCPSRISKTVKGRLYRKIYFKNDVVFQDISNNFEFKPGGWNVDAFIKVPPRAEPGTYFFKLIFNNKVDTIERNLYFVVEK